MPVISKAKLEDIEWRNRFLETMQVGLRMYEKTKDEKWLDCAKKFGETSATLRERIERGDYVNRDTEIAKVEEILKRR